ncbi:MAG: xylulokinase [Propionibacterium sp.]|nr:xylulokinase [Propionibacterium sp.]
MLVAGVDTSTQSCKVLVCRADDGTVVRSGQAPHPDGTSCDPAAWWDAFQLAAVRAGGLADVAAISVGGQQHGMVCLDADGAVIRDALLWNDTRSARAARELTDELGAEAWANAVGSVPVASYTVTKLRWLADNEPDNAARIAAICLPHDWLTWKMAGAKSLEGLTTDRSDASGTGYFDAVAGEYRRDLLAHALRIDEADAERIILPRVLGPSDAGGSADGVGAPEALLGPGCGDNAGAALGLGVGPGETWLSLGTSGVVGAVSDQAWNDATGTVSGFADATGRYLPLQVTLNGAPIVDHVRRLLDVDYSRFAELALEAEPGAGGLVLLPYFGGERTPNLPDATASLHGMTSTNTTPANLARAAVEALLCLLGVCVDRAAGHGEITRVLLVGGGAKSEATRRIAPSVLGRPVDVPPDGEYVARGAARQAAWALEGGAEPPGWPLGDMRRYEAEHAPSILGRYREVFASQSW